MKKIFLILIFTLSLIVMWSIPAYAEDCSKYITVTHIFKHHHFGLDDIEFTYKLISLSPEAPMTESNHSDEYSWSVYQSETRDIGPFVYTTPGNYSYEIYQQIDEEKPGYTYDKNRYTILHHVDKTMNVTTTIQNQLGDAKIEAVVFENTFESIDGLHEGMVTKTGDTMNIKLYFALFLFCAASLIAYLFILIAGKIRGL